MSIDRVEFTCKETERFVDEAARAAVKAFGVSRVTADEWFRKEKRIRCRPSQFARFIIYRVENGISINQIRILDPKLIDLVCPEIVDVSKNPRDK